MTVLLLGRSVCSVSQLPTPKQLSISHHGPRGTPNPAFLLGDRMIHDDEMDLQWVRSLHTTPIARPTLIQYKLQLLGLNR